MNTLFSEEEMKYSGEQLRSHWIWEEFGIEGDAAVSFVGPCAVERKWIVDVEDLRGDNVIHAKSMVHFIVEHFDPDMGRAVLRQRLLVSLAGELLNEMSETVRVVRAGDDLYVGDGKLSVSIATVSPVSALIHLGLNVTKEGVPVKAASLEELGVEPKALAERLLDAYASDMEEFEAAKRKARWVR